MNIIDYAKQLKMGGGNSGEEVIKLPLKFEHYSNDAINVPNETIERFIKCANKKICTIMEPAGTKLGPGGPVDITPGTYYTYLMSGVPLRVDEERGTYFYLNDFESKGNYVRAKTILVFNNQMFFYELDLCPRKDEKEISTCFDITSQEYFYISEEVFEEVMNNTDSDVVVHVKNPNMENNVYDSVKGKVKNISLANTHLILIVEDSVCKIVFRRNGFSGNEDTTYQAKIIFKDIE